MGDYGASACYPEEGRVVLIVATRNKQEGRKSGHGYVVLDVQTYQIASIRLCFPSFSCFG